MILSKAITTAHVEKAMTYEAYSQLIETLLAENKTTGANHSEKMIEYTKMNEQRRKRLDKTTQVISELESEIKDINEKWYWLVLTEAWCGDAAQNIPVIAKMASVNPHVELKLLLRDENPEVMEAYLTNGGKSIPKLISLKAENLEEMGTWGPRPKPAQQMVEAYKANPTSSYADFVKEIQLWYAKDKTQSIQQEFLALIKQWKNG
jgi:hypothetical protein